MNKGIYCLVLRGRGGIVPVGALGGVSFRNGWYIYVGSARGPGGLRRVQRHLALAGGEERPRHWHIDYILTNPAFLLTGIVCGVTAEDLECSLARVLGGDHVPGFGCSDCHCPSHLFYRPTNPGEEIRSAFRQIHLAHMSTTIMRRGDMVRS